MIKKSESLFIRFTPADKEALNKAAEYDNRKVTDFVRTYSVRAAKEFIAKQNQGDVLQQLNVLYKSGFFDPDKLKELEKE